MCGLFAEEEIDRAAVEDVRLDAVDWFDRASAIAVDAWVQIASQLDVDQRELLIERRQQRFARLRSLIRRGASAMMIAAM